jgi:hypothetical protein
LQQGPGRTLADIPKPPYSASALNDAILAKIDGLLDGTPPGRSRTELLTLREELKSHRPGLLDRRASAMKP